MKKLFWRIYYRTTSQRLAKNGWKVRTIKCVYPKEIYWLMFSNLYWKTYR